MGNYINFTACISYFLVLKFRLEFLVVSDLTRGFHEVLIDTVVSIFPDCEHACLSADVTQISSVELLTYLC